MGAELHCDRKKIKGPRSAGNFSRGNRERRINRTIPTARSVQLSALDLPVQTVSFSAPRDRGWRATRRPDEWFS
jgi:hypothetical protein